MYFCDVTKLAHLVGFLTVPMRGSTYVSYAATRAERSVCVLTQPDFHHPRGPLNLLWLSRPAATAPALLRALADALVDGLRAALDVSLELGHVAVVR